MLNKKEGAAAMLKKIRQYYWVIPLLLVTAIAIFVGLKLLKPGAPTRVVLATGAPGGAYEGYGKQYVEIFKREGVKLDIKPTKGSVENLALLLDKTNDIEAAFLQSGIAAEAQRDELVSLGSLFYEPVWVFYREPANKARLTRISELVGKRIAIGAVGGGTRPVSQALLAANEITAANASFNDAGSIAAAQMLQRGEIDVVFLVAAPASPLIRELLAAPGVRLMNMATADAYSRLVPAMTKITIPRGVIDLKNDVPGEDIQTVAATATLVAMESLHPAIAYLFVKAAKEIHEGGSQLHAQREFPSVTKFQEFNVPENVERLYKEGTPFLYRHMPFWLANLVQRLWILLIPLGAILVSASDAIPKIMGYKMNFRVTQIYQAAYKLENDIIRATNGNKNAALQKISPEASKLFDDRLHGLMKRTDKLRGPSATIKSWYELRGHLELVEARLQQLRSSDSDAHAH
jgi:TRAP transporter TAXI family solute receptor